MNAKNLGINFHWFLLWFRVPIPWFPTSAYRFVSIWRKKDWPHRKKVIQQQMKWKCKRDNPKWKIEIQARKFRNDRRKLKIQALKCSKVRWIQKNKKANCWSPNLANTVKISKSFEIFVKITKFKKKFLIIQKSFKIRVETFNWIFNWISVFF